MISKKTSEEIAILREGGAILASMLKDLGAACVPGATTMDLDDLAMELSEKHNVEPVLLGYHPSFADRPFPGCRSAGRLCPQSRLQRRHAGRRRLLSNDGQERLPLLDGGGLP